MLFALAHGAGDLAVGFALLDGLALVVAAAALGQRHLDLGVVALDIDAQRYDGEALLAGEATKFQSCVGTTDYMAPGACSVPRSPTSHRRCCSC